MLNDILKQLRTKKGLTTDQLADAIGISGSAYRNYERGERAPDYEKLIKIADFYGVTTDYLLGREPAPNPIEILNSVSLKKDTLDTLEAYMQLPETIKQMIIDFMIQLSQSKHQIKKSEQSKQRCVEKLGDLYDDKEAEEQAKRKGETFSA